MSAIVAEIEELEPKEDLFLAALLSESTVQDAAAKAGITARTGHRYLATEEFQKAYKLARKEAVNHAIQMVQSAMTEAIVTLRTIMTDPETPATVRVSAARTILDNGFKAAELEEFGDRIERLEELAEAAGSR
jgi:uncharacterized protein YggE